MAAKATGPVAVVLVEVDPRDKPEDDNGGNSHC